MVYSIFELLLTLNTYYSFEQTLAIGSWTCSSTDERKQRMHGHIHNQFKTNSRPELFICPLNILRSQQLPPRWHQSPLTGPFQCYITFSCCYPGLSSQNAYAYCFQSSISKWSNKSPFMIFFTHFLLRWQAFILWFWIRMDTLWLAGAVNTCLQLVFTF